MLELKTSEGGKAYIDVSHVVFISQVATIRLDKTPDLSNDFMVSTANSYCVTVPESEVSKILDAIRNDKPKRHTIDDIISAIDVVNDVRRRLADKESGCEK